MMDAAHNNQVMLALDQYFDGLYRADPSTLRPIFHDHLTYVNATRGAYVAKGLSTYMDDIAERAAPDELGEQRNPRMTQISRVGNRIMFVQASLSMMDKDYLDALTFINTDDGWKIIAKVFSHTPSGAGICPM